MPLHKPRKSLISLDSAVGTGLVISTGMKSRRFAQFKQSLIEMLAALALNPSL